MGLPVAHRVLMTRRQLAADLQRTQKRATHPVLVRLAVGLCRFFKVLAMHLNGRAVPEQGHVAVCLNGRVDYRRRDPCRHNPTYSLQRRHMLGLELRQPLAHAPTAGRPHQPQRPARDGVVAQIVKIAQLAASRRQASKERHQVLLIARATVATLARFKAIQQLQQPQSMGRARHECQTRYRRQLLVREVPG